MKKLITYRAITVAIGIVVAVVIAVTLWMREPDQAAVSGFQSKPPATLPLSANKIVDTTIQLLSSFQARTDN